MGEIHLRRIRNRRLLISGIVYRVLVIFINGIFFWLGVRACLDAVGPIGASLIWNAINMIIYFTYHYPFARLFKLGVDN